MAIIRWTASLPAARIVQNNFFHLTDMTQVAGGTYTQEELARAIAAGRIDFGFEIAAANGATALTFTATRVNADAGTSSLTATNIITGATAGPKRAVGRFHAGDTSRRWPASGFATGHLHGLTSAGPVGIGTDLLFSVSAVTGGPPDITFHAVAVL